jgi:hypothetical protein
VRHFKRRVRTDTLAEVRQHERIDGTEAQAVFRASSQD